MKRFASYIILLLLVSMSAHAQGYNIPFSPQASGGAPLSISAMLSDANGEKFMADCGGISDTCMIDTVTYTKAWTVEVMINCSDDDDSWKSIWQIDDDGANGNTGGVYAADGDATNNSIFNWNSAWTDLHLETAICDDAWHRHTVTHAASSLVVITYIDGVSQGTSTNNTGTGDPIGGDEFMIGPASSAAGDFTGGHISDVRIWSDVRTITEIAALDQCQLDCADGTTSCHASLEHYWPINEGTGNGAEMVGGTNSVVMVPTGGATWDTGGLTFTNNGASDGSGSNCYDDGS